MLDRCVLATAVLLCAAACTSQRAPAQSALDTFPPNDSHHGPHHADQHGSHGMPHRFEHADDWARVFDDPARDAWQKPSVVVAAMRITPGMKVADIGAGTGYFLPYLSRAVGPTGSVLGVDIEPDMVRYMTKRAAREGMANTRAQLAKPDDPGLPARSVDRILIVDTWHHIANRPAYAALLARALSDGGMVFVVDFSQESSHGPPREHRLPPEAVIQELSQGGLAAEQVPVDLPDQYVVAGKLSR